MNGRLHSINSLKWSGDIRKTRTGGLRLLGLGGRNKRGLVRRSRWRRLGRGSLGSHLAALYKLLLYDQESLGFGTVSPP